MSAILDAAAAIVEAIQIGIPELARTRTYHAPIDGEEIARELHKCPEAVVVFTGGTPTWSGGALYILAHWSVCIVTEGPDPKRRTAQCISIAERVFRIVNDSEFGGTARRAADTMQMRPLYTGQIDERAIAITTISWVQQIAIPPPTPGGELEDWLRTTVEISPGSPL